MDLRFLPTKPLSKLAAKMLEEAEVEAKATGIPIIKDTGIRSQSLGVIACAQGPVFFGGLAAMLRTQRGKKEDLKWLQTKCDPEVASLAKSAMDDGSPSLKQALQDLSKLFGNQTTKQVNKTSEWLQTLGEVASHPRGAMLLFGENAATAVSFLSYLEWLFSACESRLADKTKTWPFSAPFSDSEIANAYRAAMEVLTCWVVLHEFAKYADKLPVVWRNPTAKMSVIARFVFQRIADLESLVEPLRRHAVRHYPEPIRVTNKIAASWHHLILSIAKGMAAQVFAKLRPLDAVESFQGAPEKLTGEEIRDKWDDITPLFRFPDDVIPGELGARIEFEAGKFDVILGRPESPQDGFPTLHLDAIHGPDFRSVKWGEYTFSFTSNQSLVIKLLWAQWERGTPDVGDETLLKEVDHAAPPSRLNVLFRNNPAFGKMIVKGATKGTHRLTQPPQSK